MTSPPKGLSSSFSNRFELGTLLGEGSFGAVFDAMDKSSGKKVAIKFLSGGDDQIRQRFVTEAKLAASVRHDNIVSVIDWSCDEDQLYIVYEFVDGPSLRTFLDKGRITTKRAKKIICELAKALSELHGQSIVHRDVKPENVIIDSDGKPKLTDLGIAKSLLGYGVKTQTGIIVGTPQYIAPEIISGHPPSGSADVYSLGVILYEMLTGKWPFDGDIQQVVKSHLSSKAPPLPAGVSPALAKLTQKMLRKKPEERPSTKEIIDRLGGELSSSSIIKTQLINVAHQQPTEKTSHRFKVILCFSICLLALVIAWNKTPNPSRAPTNHPSWSSDEKAIRELAVRLSTPTGKLSSQDRDWLREMAPHAIRFSQETISALAEATCRAGIGDKEMHPVRCLLTLSCCFLSNELSHDPKALGSIAIKLIEPLGKFKAFNEGESPLLSSARLAVLESDATRYIRNDFTPSHKRGLPEQVANAFSIFEGSGGMYSFAEKWLVLATLIELRTDLEDGNLKKRKMHIDRCCQCFSKIMEENHKELSLFTKILLRNILEIYFKVEDRKVLLARYKLNLKDEIPPDKEITSPISMFRYQLLMHKCAMSHSDWKDADNWLLLAKKSITNKDSKKLQLLLNFHRLLQLEDQVSDLRERKDIQKNSREQIAILNEMMKEDSCWSVDLRYKRAAARQRITVNDREHELVPLIKKDLQYVVKHANKAFNPKVPGRADTWLISLRLPGKIDPSIFNEAGQYQSRELKRRYESGLKD